MIVLLHVATGAAVGAATNSRIAALSLGPVLHLAGDRVPHRDLHSTRLEIGSGVLGLGWHRSGPFPASVQLLLAGTILGALLLSDNSSA